MGPETVRLPYRLSPQALVTRGIKVLLMTGDDGEALTRGHLTQGTTSLFSVSCTVRSETQQRSF